MRSWVAFQAHEGMDALKSNLRQEHWEVMNWVTKCFEITTPIQTARFMLGSHPRWCTPWPHAFLFWWWQHSQCPSLVCMSVWT